jgi:hypothetical protein
MCCYGAPRCAKGTTQLGIPDGNEAENFTDTYTSPGNNRLLGCHCLCLLTCTCSNLIMPHEREDAGLIAFEASPHAAAKSEVTRLPSLTASGSLPDTATEGGSVKKSGMVAVTCQVRRRVARARAFPC